MKTPNNSNNRKLVRLAAIILLVFLLLALSACESSRQSQVDIDYKQVHTGSQGLVTGFLTPPEGKVLYTPESDFQIALQLDNLGAADIINGFVVFDYEEDYVALNSIISPEDIKKEFVKGEPIPIGYIQIGQGSNPEAQTGVSKGLNKLDMGYSSPFTLKGKSITRLQGEREIITIDAITKDLGEVTQAKPSFIMAAACYQYRTELKEEVCINPDVYDQRIGVKSCRLTNLKLDSQGAPVAVVSLKEEITLVKGAVKPQFIIKLANVGDGMIFSLKNNPRDMCLSANKPDGVVYITAYLGDNKEVGEALKCTPSEFKIEEYPSDVYKPDDLGISYERVINCEVTEPIEATAAYTTPLIIELDYGYMSFVSRSILLQQANK
ncbi:hypothetical protein COT48_01225 [Candidatus Woesearchaeota archaeon CG08_land_8_20_14_0_20_47_9]|nr:MAG: hypothetical protein AUJ69_04365 [Candidatus Woesearchaeota archaeon CG1_02_47_18]PIO04283.1 MAG: hypothetical protein COT48_01225 [Candidatus Woesearchaeota archaeon CG08_land_8_20_14_0_20_47_9]